MLTLVAFVVAIAALGAALGLSHRTKRAEAEIVKEQAKVRVLLGSLSSRYQIKVVDWGPDFTGENDILPRWRWAVLDADHPLRTALDPEYTGTEPKVYMLGNSHSKADAYFDAMAWIERQANPLLILDTRDM